MTSSRSWQWHWKGNAVAICALLSCHRPGQSSCGTIRQEMALNIQENSVHASDSPENARAEVAFFFG
jgi:nucleoside diphosphate kinase